MEDDIRFGMDEFEYMILFFKVSFVIVLVVWFFMDEKYELNLLICYGFKIFRINEFFLCFWWNDVVNYFLKGFWVIYIILNFLICMMFFSFNESFFYIIVGYFVFCLVKFIVCEEKMMM